MRTPDCWGSSLWSSKNEPLSSKQGGYQRSSWQGSLWTISPFLVTPWTSWKCRKVYHRRIIYIFLLAIYRVIFYHLNLCYVLFCADHFEFPQTEQFSRLLDALNCGSTSDDKFKHTDTNYTDQERCKLILVQLKIHPWPPFVTSLSEVSLHFLLIYTVKRLTSRIAHLQLQ